MDSFKSLLFREYENNIKKNSKKLVIDIDGVVATLVKSGDYSKSKPIRENINKLKQSGLKIIF